ncbi:MAG: hypothetical protein GKR90_00285 [Pseudomonadales bacterium]|nr:hypothetical protein [Pseudomonadales bacterium]
MSEIAKNCARAFITAFNAQDHEALADTLNYPHLRLANGRFAQVETREDFVAISKSVEPKLREEGWHHTTVESMDVVHEGDDKVHLAIRNHRCRNDDSIYNTFDTLWIVTKENDHWGIQFRSSYLR